MGMLVDGVWQDIWYDTKSTGGRFKRQESIFRQKISHDGSTPFAPAANRYHYASGFTANEPTEGPEKLIKNHG